MEQQAIQGVGDVANHTLELLRLQPTGKRDNALLITVLEAHPAQQSPVVRPALELLKGGALITLRSGTAHHEFCLRQEGASVLTPAFEHRQPRRVIVGR
jgi:hypothetical protein